MKSQPLDLLTELGYEYARIVVRQEHGLDGEGEPVEHRYEPGDSKRMARIEKVFHYFDASLDSYVECVMDELGL